MTGLGPASAPVTAASGARCRCTRPASRRGRAPSLPEPAVGGRAPAASCAAWASSARAAAIRCAASSRVEGRVASREAADHVERQPEDVVAAFQDAGGRQAIAFGQQRAADVGLRARVKRVVVLGDGGGLARGAEQAIPPARSAARRVARESSRAAAGSLGLGRCDGARAGRGRLGLAPGRRGDVPHRCLVAEGGDVGGACAARSGSLAAAPALGRRRARGRRAGDAASSGGSSSPAGRPSSTSRSPARSARPAPPVAPRRRAARRRPRKSPAPSPANSGAASRRAARSSSGASACPRVGRGSARARCRRRRGKRDSRRSPAGRRAPRSGRRPAPPARPARARAATGCGRRPSASPIAPPACGVGGTGPLVRAELQEHERVVGRDPLDLDGAVAARRVASASCSRAQRRPDRPARLDDRRRPVASGPAPPFRRRPPTKGWTSTAIGLVGVAPVRAQVGAAPPGVSAVASTSRSARPRRRRARRSRATS